MASYRMYSLDGAGRISYGEEIEAIADDEAIARVREMRPNALKCELWEGRRLVATLNERDLFPQAS